MKYLTVLLFAAWILYGIQLFKVPEPPAAPLSPHPSWWVLSKSIWVDEMLEWETVNVTPPKECEHSPWKWNAYLGWNPDGSYFVKTACILGEGEFVGGNEAKH